MRESPLRFVLDGGVPGMRTANLVCVVLATTIVYDSEGLAGGSIPADDHATSCVMPRADALSLTFRRVVDSIDTTNGLVSRVRILTPQIAHGFQKGISRSSTFRRLVDAIDATNGLVYVEQGVCRQGARSCLLGSVVVAGPNRILRVVINRTQLGDDLLVSLGHELQHAAEVLGEPTVTTSAEMRWHFRAIGIKFGDMFETNEATRVGDAIRRELATWARRGGDTRSR
jgi:hypothetical protein